MEKLRFQDFETKILQNKKFTFGLRIAVPYTQLWFPQTHLSPISSLCSFFIISEIRLRIFCPAKEKRAYVRASVRACVCAYVRACVRACVCVCVCVLLMNWMLCHSLGGAVIFCSLQHFITTKKKKSLKKKQHTPQPDYPVNQAAPDHHHEKITTVY